MRKFIKEKWVLYRKKNATCPPPSYTFFFYRDQLNFVIFSNREEVCGGGGGRRTLWNQPASLNNIFSIYLARIYKKSVFCTNINLQVKRRLGLAPFPYPYLYALVWTMARRATKSFGDNKYFRCMWRRRRRRITLLMIWRTEPAFCIWHQHSPIYKHTCAAYISMKNWLLKGIHCWHIYIHGVMCTHFFSFSAMLFCHATQWWWWWCWFFGGYEWYRDDDAAATSVVVVVWNFV